MLIVNTVLYTLRDLVGLLSCVFLIHGIMKYEYRKKSVIISSFCAMALITSSAMVLFQLTVDDKEVALALSDALSTILMMLLPLVILKCAKKLSHALFLLVYIMTADVIFGVMAPVLPDYIFLEAIVYIVVFSVVILLVKITANNPELSILSNVFSSIPKWIYVCLVVFDLTGYYKEFGISSQFYNILYAISTIMVILCVLYFIGKIFIMTYQQNQIIKRMDSQREYYNNMLSGNDDLRQFRHDYKNHMMVITTLLNTGKTQEASDYLEIINQQSGVLKKKISTGNDIADAIINNKLPLAEDYGISLTFDGRIPTAGIENVDVCTIFANLLDNAVEATKKFEGLKYIKVSANVRNGYLALSFVNPADNVKISGNKIKTTKSDKKNHGIGLRNVEATTKKYSGNLILSYENNEFIADVNLKLQ